MKSKLFNKGYPQKIINAISAALRVIKSEVSGAKEDEEKKEKLMENMKHRLSERVNGAFKSSKNEEIKDALKTFLLSSKNQNQTRLHQNLIKIQ